MKTLYTFVYAERGWFMAFTATFSNISVISWQSVLLVEETREHGENHWHAASHWQTLSHNVVSSTLENHWHAASHWQTLSHNVVSSTLENHW
jgi:hypothetical protein